MKKILTLLLVLTITLVGCGKLSDKEKVNAAEAFVNSDDSITKDLKNEGYTEMEYMYGVFYIKSKQINEEKITEKELESYQNLAKFESFTVIVSDGMNVFMGSYREKEGSGYINYLVIIMEENVSLQIVKEDRNGELIAMASYKYKDGELNLDDTGSYGDSKSLIKDHEKKAKKFFEKAFKELRSVMK